MFLCTQCCELKVVHKKQCHLFIFWLISTIFMRIVSRFLFKIKIWPMQLSRRRFKVQNQTLVPGWSVFIGFWPFAQNFDKNCLTNLTLFTKLDSDYCSSTGNDFSVRHLITAPKQSRVDDSSCHILRGPYIHSLLYDVHQKALYQRPWPSHTCWFTPTLPPPPASQTHDLLSSVHNHLGSQCTTANCVNSIVIKNQQSHIFATKRFLTDKIKHVLETPFLSHFIIFYDFLNLNQCLEQNCKVKFVCNCRTWKKTLFFSNFGE